MTEQNIAAMIQQRQNKFIETRTIIETEVNKFLNSLQGLDAEYKEKLGVQPGITCKDLLPELWNEPFRTEVYDKQLANLQSYITQVQCICDKINQEALACLQ